MDPGIVSALEAASDRDGSPRSAIKGTDYHVTCCKLDACFGLRSARKVNIPLTIMVAAGSITVAVRVRPPTSWEVTRLADPCYDTVIRTDGALSAPLKPIGNGGCLRDIVQIIDDRILTFDPDEKDRSRAFVERGFMPPGSKRYKDKRFMFDKVFNHDAQQQDVYGATAEPLLKGLLDGYNATVFAYGVSFFRRDLKCTLKIPRLRVAARHILSAAQSPTQASFTSPWPIYFNALRIAETNGTLRSWSHSSRSTMKKFVISSLSLARNHLEASQFAKTSQSK